MPPWAPTLLPWSAALTPGHTLCPPVPPPQGKQSTGFRRGATQRAAEACRLAHRPFPPGSPPPQGFNSPSGLCARASEQGQRCALRPRAPQRLCECGPVPGALSAPWRRGDLSSLGAGCRAGLV